MFCVYLKTSFRPWAEREEEERGLSCSPCSKIISLFTPLLRLFHCKYITTDFKSARKLLWNDTAVCVCVCVFFSILPPLSKVAFTQEQNIRLVTFCDLIFFVSEHGNTACHCVIHLNRSCTLEGRWSSVSHLSPTSLHHRTPDIISSSCVPVQRLPPMTLSFPDREYNHG